MSATTSPWKNGFFLLFVTATFVSNLGTWLFNVAAGWLMTDIGGSALSVSLVQTANLLPLVLLAVPAGTLGDLADRRKILLIGQSALIVVNAVFAYLVMVDAVTPGWLLFFTLLNGAGAAVCAPLLTAVIPQMVAREHLSTAMSIGGISFNAARAVGPILCGWLIVSFSLDLPFWIDAASFAAVVVVIAFWKDDRALAGRLRPQTFGFAMGDSLRFLRYTPALYNSVLRAILFFLGAGALWALLPLVAKNQLGGDANLYGRLVGTIGIGAVITGVAYNWIVDRLGGANRMVVGLSILLGGALVGLALADNVYVAYPVALIAGASWQLTFTALITSTQFSLPRWFGVRGMAYYFMAMGLSLSLGSAFWGWLADTTTLGVAHYAAAGVCVVTAFLGRRFPLDQARGADLSAFTKYPTAPVPAGEEEDPGGVLLYRNRYRIPAESRDELVAHLHKLRNKRFRSGALRWELFVPLDKEENSPSANEVIETYRELRYTAVERHDRRITQVDQEALANFGKWLKENGGEVEQEVLREEG